MEIDIYKAKILNFIKRKNQEVLKYTINSISVLGNKVRYSSFKPHIEQLKKIDALIEKDNKINITDKGLELLNSNQHLLERFKAERKIKKKSDKTHCNKGIPTTEDIVIMEHVKSLIIKNKISELKTTIIAKHIGVSSQLVSRRLKRLKNAGHIYYIPRRIDSMRIIKDIN